MKLVIDSQAARLFSQHPLQIVKDPLLSEGRNEISFRWPSLFAYLDLDSIFSPLPAFDANQPLFIACVATMNANEEKEVLFYMYDRLFAENLRHIRTLPQIDASFLLHAIQQKREKPSFAAIESFLSPALSAIESALREKESDTLHDLILYLAWDRLCVWMARLFDYPSAHPSFIQGLFLFKQCLIESYLHIAEQRRTSPSIYRMLEACFFYAMREENLQKHTKDEWTLLNQSFSVLEAQEELIDLFYIDEAILAEEKEKSEEDTSCYVTLDSPDRVHCRVAFAHCMMNQLKAEFPEWRYRLQPKKMTHLQILN